MNRSRKKSTKKSRAVKGAASKTHKGDKDYTTKKGNKDFHRKSHDVKLRRKPYKKSRSLNSFMQAKEKARKADKASFMYKGQKYTKSMTKTGMAIYKKARKASRKASRKVQEQSEQMRIVVSYGHSKTWPKGNFTLPKSWKYVGYEGAFKSQPKYVTNNAYFIGSSADAAKATKSLRTIFQKYKKNGYVTNYSIKKEKIRYKRKAISKSKRKASRKPRRKASRKPKRKASRKPRRKASRKSRRKASRKPSMNSFMQAKEKARKADKASFMYKGQKYTKSMTKTGMAIYKKAGAYKFEKKWNPDSYRSMLADDCFLSPKNRKYPICNRQGVPVCQGVMAAYARARLVADTKRVSPKKRAEARRIAEKARRLKKKHGCVPQK